MKREARIKPCHETQMGHSPLITRLLSELLCRALRIRRLLELSQGCTGTLNDGYLCSLRRGIVLLP